MARWNITKNKAKANKKEEQIVNEILKESSMANDNIDVIQDANTILEKNDEAKKIMEDFSNSIKEGSTVGEVEKNIKKTIEDIKSVQQTLTKIGEKNSVSTWNGQIMI